MFETHLALRQRGLQAHFLRQMPHQPHAPGPCCLRRRNIGGRRKAIVDLDRVHTARSIEIDQPGGLCRGNFGSLKVEARDFDDARRAHVPGLDAPVPCALVADAGDQAVAFARAVHHVPDIGHPIGDPQREMHLRRRLEGVGMHVPQPGDQEAALRIDAPCARSCGRRSDCGDGAAAHQHRCGRACRTRLDIDDADIVDDQRFGCRGHRGRACGPEHEDSEQGDEGRQRKAGPAQDRARHTDYAFLAISPPSTGMTAPVM